MHFHTFYLLLLLNFIGVNAAPHRSLRVKKHGPRHGAEHPLTAILIGKKADPTPTPSATSQGIPVLVAPSPTKGTPPNSHPGLRKGEFRVLFAPPVVKEAGDTCTKQATTTSASDVGTRTSTSTLTIGSTPSASPSSHVAAVSNKPMMMAYYPDWAGRTMPPEKVDFDRFDWVDFAFAVPDANFNLKFTQDDSEDLLRRLVIAAHAKNKGVKLSVGGWTGSKYFSTAVSTSENRKLFAQKFVAIYNKFNLDGIDIDWEYPGTPGDSGNVVSSSDSRNFLEFLKVLRVSLPQGAVITAATQVWPFAGPDGRPMSDVREFAKLFDWILMMNYDVWGSSSTPGPNAPLDDGCHNSTQPLANAVAAVKSWTAAGMPLEKLTLGVPSYGYISRSKVQQLSGRSESVTVKNDDGGTNNGQMQFNGLISQGALVKKDGVYVGAGGFQRRWDSCSSTPFLRSESQGQIITYDDPQSLKIKGDFAKKAGIKGINMFDVHGDTSNWELVDAVRSGLGLM